MTDGQKIAAAGVTFEVLFTPGHTSGGCCYSRRQRTCCSVGIHCFGVPSEGVICRRGDETTFDSFYQGEAPCSAGKYSGISRAYGSDDYSDREDSKSISGVSGEKIKPILLRKMSESYKEQKRCFV